MNKFALIISLVVVTLFVLFTFFWVFIRPSIIYSHCHTRAEEKALFRASRSPEGTVRDAAKDGRYSQDSYNIYYNRCLRETGINATNVTNPSD